MEGLSLSLSHIHAHSCLLMSTMTKFAGYWQCEFLLCNCYCLCFIAGVMGVGAFELIQNKRQTWSTIVTMHSLKMLQMRNALSLRGHHCGVKCFSSTLKNKYDNLTLLTG
eukprot:TRINITY_DN9818_c0_g1_i2.p1 TRINITY_DN9818_c0_g1~~TRINITY_DN9818_c0_g1_i2.p1  ORF type:complete len:110 (+),score=13.13 TRINITY_DN9818_c0_g1_i2:76-405(+)